MSVLCEQMMKSSVQPAVPGLLLNPKMSGAVSFCFTFDVICRKKTG